MRTVKPFLKWAGGKTQLASQIQSLIPKQLANAQNMRIIEPFAGSAAVTFALINARPAGAISTVLNDTNFKLIATYKAVRDNLEQLGAMLSDMQAQYHALLDCESKKKAYYYAVRERFNSSEQAPVELAANFIFLNRTGFNGLYRENLKGHFNVPIGSYKKPTIYDHENLKRVSEALQGSSLLCGDFDSKEINAHLTAETLVYLDPPYRPLSKTANFNSYSSGGFDDHEQARLASFCRKLSAKGVPWILSNSDPKNNDPDDNFFDDLYSGFNIQRVSASRRINSKASRRGDIKEILVSDNLE